MIIYHVNTKILKCANILATELQNQFPLGLSYLILFGKNTDKLLQMPNCETKILLKILYYIQDLTIKCSLAPSSLQKS